MKQNKKLAPKEAIELMTTIHGVNYLTARNVLRGRHEISESELEELLQKRTHANVSPLSKVRIKNIELQDRQKTRNGPRSKKIYCEDPYSETLNFVRELKI